MAFRIVRDNNDKHQTGREITAVLDSSADLTALGTEYAPGSIAIVAGAGAPTYMMNASGQWKEI